jgi:glutamate dehydrogenase/leucine dehydrogenase
MNVDEVEEVIPFCKEQDIDFPLEGIINGHFNLSGVQKTKIIQQLTTGVPLNVTNKELLPLGSKKYCVGDLITGYGVSESVVHFYNIYGGDINGKRVIIQGWGNVAATAAYYLAQAGAIIVGIIDKNGGLINQEGFTLEEVAILLEKRYSNYLEDQNIRPFDEINNEIWSIGAEIFIPAAASRLVQSSHLENMIANKLEVISCGANVPFADKEIFFGPIAKKADSKISLIPDFISNCGMARTFSYLMETEIKMDDFAIFESVSKTIYEALLESNKMNNKKTNIASTAFEIALKKLN